MTPPNDALSFEAKLKKIRINGPAPVDKWNPKFCGDVDIQIKKNGNWYHNGKKINRKPLIKVFSNILKKENDKFFLVTPFEKVGIKVEDVPFLINDLDIKGNGKKQKILVKTNVDEKVVINKKNYLKFRIDEKTEEPFPYVLIRDNLEGLIDRKNFYRLIEKVQIEVFNGVEWYGIWSNENFFPLQKASDLDIKLNE